MRKASRNNVSQLDIKSAGDLSISLEEHEERASSRLPWATHRAGPTKVKARYRLVPLKCLLLQGWHARSRLQGSRRRRALRTITSEATFHPLCNVCTVHYVNDRRNLVNWFTSPIARDRATRGQPRLSTRRYTRDTAGPGVRYDDGAWYDFSSRVPVPTKQPTPIDKFNMAIPAVSLNCVSLPSSNIISLLRFLA